MHRAPRGQERTDSPDPAFIILCRSHDVIYQPTNLPAHVLFLADLVCQMQDQVVGKAVRTVWVGVCCVICVEDYFTQGNCCIS